MPVYNSNHTNIDSRYHEKVTKLKGLMDKTGRNSVASTNERGSVFGGNVPSIQMPRGSMNKKLVEQLIEQKEELDLIKEPTNFVDISQNRSDVIKARIAKNKENAKNADIKSLAPNYGNALKHKVYGETLIDRIKIKLEENNMARSDGEN